MPPDLAERLARLPHTRAVVEGITARPGRDQPRPDLTKGRRAEGEAMNPVVFQGRKVQPLWVKEGVSDSITAVGVFHLGKDWLYLVQRKDGTPDARWMNGKRDAKALFDAMPGE